MCPRIHKCLVLINNILDGNDKLSYSVGYLRIFGKKCLLFFHIHVDFLKMNVPIQFHCFIEIAKINKTPYEYDKWKVNYGTHICTSFPLNIENRLNNTSVCVCVCVFIDLLNGKILQIPIFQWIDVSD